MKKFIALSGLLLLQFFVPALANNDRIPFAGLGGIRDFRDNGQTGIYVQDQSKQWYYASFFAPCFALRFHDRVGFVLEPSNSLDKFSSILVGGDQCYFKSFTKTADPAKAKVPENG